MANETSDTTQIWADGYSFMEVTETLMMALGIPMDDGPPKEPGPQRTGTALAPELDPASETPVEQ